MKLGGLALVAGAGVLAWLLSKARGTAGPLDQEVQVSRPLEELPGVTFPAPGVVGVVTGPAGEVLAENYLIGTAEQAWENARAIEAARPNVFNELPVSYAQIAHLDINPERWGVDYELGGGRVLSINPDVWGIIDRSPEMLAKYGGFGYQTVSYGGSSPAVWHNYDFLAALREAGITDWRA